MSILNLWNSRAAGVVISLFIGLGLAYAASPVEDSPNPQKAVLTAEGQLVPFQIDASQVAELNITIHLIEGYKAYADQFKVSIQNPEGFHVSKIQISPLKSFFDKFTKKQREGVLKTAVLKTVIEAPRSLQGVPHELEVQLTYQACSEGFCLFPQTTTVKVPFQVKEPTVLVDESGSLEKDTSLLSMNFSQAFKRGLLWTFLFVFAAGILTSFTPCIFPMIPITLSVLGRSAHVRTRGENFFVSVLYVLGIALTYAIMGVVAASTGALFGSFMSHPVVLSVMCLVFLAMSFSMFGFYEFQAPAFIQNRFADTSDLTGYSGAFFSGVMSGVVASPCVGPVLVGILTYIAKTQNLWLGFFLMFVYALGMGQIFLVLGLFSQSTKLLPKSGPWLDGVKHVFGVLMLGAFYYFLSLLLPQRFWDIAFGVGLALLAGYFGAFTPPDKNWKRVRKGLMQAMVILGGAFIVTGVFELRASLQQKMIHEEPGYNVKATNWLPYSEAALAKAKAEGKPVIVDFGADWCAACKELEQYTFTNQRFQLLSTRFVLLKFDATNESPELEALRVKYEIVGLPTLLFFSDKGELRKDLTLTAFEEADPFIERMTKAMKTK